MMLFFFFCKSQTMTPPGGSQVDIADVCWGGGLIQLVQAFPAGASLCLLVLLLLLSPLAKAAQQHAFNLLLALFQNILQYDKKERTSCKIYILTNLLKSGRKLLTISKVTSHLFSFYRTKPCHSAEERVHLLVDERLVFVTGQDVNIKGILLG